MLIETQAESRLAYLMNPELGRTLAPAARARLQPGPFDGVLVIADGLSATAIHRHGAALAERIFAHTPQIAWAPTAIVRNGRVAIADEIAQALAAAFAVVMIGERPGLSTADSIGLYFTLRPQTGVTKDADRNCISNVRPGGLALDEAAYRLAWLVSQARKLGVSGVTLKEDAPEAARLPDGRV